MHNQNGDDHERPIRLQPPASVHDARTTPAHPHPAHLKRGLCAHTESRRRRLRDRVRQQSHRWHEPRHTPHHGKHAVLTGRHNKAPTTRLLPYDMSSKINNTFNSYMPAFLMPSRALRHADASRLTQKGLGAHSSSKLDTHAALAKIRGVPPLAPLSWRSGVFGGWIMASAALAEYMHMSCVHRCACRFLPRVTCGPRGCATPCDTRQVGVQYLTGGYDTP